MFHFFEKNFANVHTILITADLNTIIKRLENRNREQDFIIKQRIERYKLKFQAKNNTVFKNQGPFAVVKDNFIELCINLVSEYLS